MVLPVNKAKSEDMARDRRITSACPVTISRKEVAMEQTRGIYFWEKYTLSIEEAAQYFRIGENKLRRLVSENKDADYVIWNGTRPQIKRTLFEKYIDRCNLV